MLNGLVSASVCGKVGTYKVTSVSKHYTIQLVSSWLNFCCCNFLAMRMRISLVVVASWLLYSIILSLAVASEDRLNKSTSGGLVWSSDKEEGELYRKTDSEDDTITLNSNDEIDGGFSSLEGMLQWAIGHSDHAKLKDTAKDVKRLSPEELKNRQVELQELLEKLKTPSDAQMMQTAINELKNSSLSLDEHLHALEELLILVEPIDNANDLNKLGGLEVLINELDDSEFEIRKLSAWVIGTASQNNPVVQKQALDLGVLKKLVKMVRSDFVLEAIKALYAISALIRNNLDGQQMFYTEGGDMMLQEILSNSSSDIRLCMKSLSLVSGMAECQLENTVTSIPPTLFSNRLFLKSVVDLTASTNLHLQEKALDAVKNLVQLRTTEAVVLRDFCGLSEVLGKTSTQLQRLMEEEDADRREYAVDVESLRREVELLFHNKLLQEASQLSQGMNVPT
ncbi:hypothetical protein V2J09_022429 [Rumex salicifolius]